MGGELLAVFLERWNWAGALLTLAGVVALTRVGKFLVFRSPALAEMREINRVRDREKLALEKYPPMIKASQKVGLYCNAAFFLAILPFIVSLDARTLWLMPLHFVAVLMFYDFFYYLMHRFWFHGKGGMRRIHAVHHQARKPTHIDGHYVHPLETFLGLSLFFLSTIAIALALGPFHVVTIALTYVAYVQLNTVNHTFVDLPYSPFRLLNYITDQHHKHHENMLMGNYGTITPLYDKLFGTYE